MKLSDYLKIKEMNHSELAKKLGVTRSYLSQIVYEKNRPSVSLAKKIQEITKGYVTVTELLCPEDYEKLDPEDILKAIEDYKTKTMRSTDEK